MAEQQTATRPPQQQKEQPGREHLMRPRPESRARRYKAAGKLEGKTALVTGGDSGIGRSVAVMFAEEGADVAIVYLKEHRDADETRRLVEAEGRRCITIAGEVANADFCQQAVERTVHELGKLDILVNNAAEQHLEQKIEDVSEEQLRRTFETNFFGYFLMTKAALPHMKEDCAIVNTTSVTAFRGSPQLIDYSSTKGAIVAFTRSLSQALAKRRIRVNAVAPGPIWTPLIPATFSPDKVQEFGSQVPLGRPGEPDEVAPCYVFLASDDASYMTGQIMHPNGGEIVGS